MQRSLLRLYTLVVCVMTAFSMALIAGVPLWHSLLHSAEAVEQKDVYQYLTTGTIKCKKCPVETLTQLTLSTRQPEGIKEFAPAAPTEAEPEKESSWWQLDWIPEWVFIVLRVVIALIGLLIFTVHWRLYKNLQFIP